MWRTLVLSGVLFALANGQTTPVSQCLNHEGELPINTYIEGCTSTPCYLPQLEFIVINMIFRAPRVLTSMRTLATAYVNFGNLQLEVPYPLGIHALTCNFLSNTYCPIIEGEVVQYALGMLIESFFPVGTSAVVEFRIVDEDSQPIVCIRAALNINPPLQTRNITSETGEISRES